LRGAQHEAITLPPKHGVSIVKTYRVLISLEIDADDENTTAQEAMVIVTDPTMVIESITETKEFDK
jgi:hypothetical protein